MKVRDELEYIPAKAKVIRYMQQACECPACKHKGKPFIKKAFTPKSVLNLSHQLLLPVSCSSEGNQDHLTPVANYLREELLKRDIIHCDETTPVQVLREDDKRPQTKSYMLSLI